jgi:hypothetical protein
MISEEVRRVESEIDNSIRLMPMWTVNREVLLGRLMMLWRDALELAHLRFAHAHMFNDHQGAKAATAIEAVCVAGVFQGLKWAMEYASPDGSSELSEDHLVTMTMNVAQPYQMLVDALKLGNHGKVDFAVDWNAKVLTVYEGGDLTGHDASIVGREHVALPFHTQNPLVDETDQLTSAWNAGQYRDFWRWLRPIAERAQTETIVGQAGPLAPPQDLVKRPVVLNLPEPPDALFAVRNDLTLTPAKAQGALKWKIDSWHDCPFVQIADRVVGISSSLLTLAGRDDYMLRVAVLNDPAQYDRVSGLREARMVSRCGELFRHAGWTFMPHHKLTSPPAEIDGYATRQSDVVIVQLKSTLRPQSPWEVRKRNEDVLGGIEHTARMVSRIDASATGFVITDGYEGDYATWAESLRTRIPVATLDDLEWIVNDPGNAFAVLAKRAGVEDDRPSVRLPERKTKLCGWTLRVLDEAKPLE